MDSLLMCLIELFQQVKSNKNNFTKLDIGFLLIVYQVSMRLIESIRKDDRAVSLTSKRLTAME